MMNERDKGRDKRDENPIAAVFNNKGIKAMSLGALALQVLVALAFVAMLSGSGILLMIGLIIIIVIAKKFRDS